MSVICTPISMTTVYDGEDGNDGTSPWIADLSNEMDSVACTLEGKPTSAQSLSTEIHLYYGSSPMSFGNPTVKRNGTSIPINDNTFHSGVKLAYSSGTLTIYYNTSASISDIDEFVITITANADSAVTRNLTFSVNGVRPGANGVPATTYNLIPSVSDIVKKKDGTYTPTQVSCYCTSICNGTATNNPSEATMQYSYNNSNWSDFTSSSTFNSSDIEANGRKLYLRLLVGGKLMDKETIPVIEDGNDGTSPYFADLDNEMDSVACDSDGHVTSEQYIESNVSFFCGNVKQTIKSSGGVACNIGGYPLSDSYAAEGSPTPATAYRAVVTGLGTTSAKVKIYIKSGTSITSTNITIEVKATINGSDETCVVTMTMNGIRPGAAGEKAVTYNLLPSVSEINVGRTDSGGYNPSTFQLTCGYKKSVGGTIDSVNDAPTKIDSKYYIYYRRRTRSSQDWEGTYYRYDYWRGDANHSLLSLDVATYDKVEFILCDCAYTSFSVSNIGNYTLIDKETVPVVADGAKGQSVKGDPGKLCYIAGIYDPAVQYTCNDDQTVAVEVEKSGSSSEIWVLTSTPPSAGYAPSDSSPYWSKGLNAYNLVRAKYLFSDFAKLGSGVVSGDWLYSANGTIDGSNYNNGANYGSTGKPGYMFFDKDAPLGSRNLNIAAEGFVNTSYETKGSAFSLSGGNRIIKVTGNVTGGTMTVTVYKGGSATGVEVTFAGYGSQYIVLTNVSAGTNFYIKAKVSTGAATGTIVSCVAISFAPKFAVDLLTGKSYQNDAYIKGEIVATSGTINSVTATNLNIQSGTISGDVTIGTGNVSIKLRPNGSGSSVGASIVAYDGTETPFSLLFDRYTYSGTYHPHATFKLESVAPYSSKCGKIEIKDTETKRTLYYGSSYIPDYTYTAYEGYESITGFAGMVHKISVNNAFHIRFGITGSGVALIQASAFPTASDKSSLPTGCIYRDGENLKVKT